MFRKRMTAREALEHDWLKQLEGGITAADVAYATHAQKEPLPDTEVSTPLVEEDYPSSSESETPLEKSLERLDDVKAIENKEAVGNDKSFIEPERKISNDSVLADSPKTEEETAKAEPSQEELKQLLEESKPLSESNESEVAKESAIYPPDVNENSSKEDDVENKKVDESLKTGKSVDIKPEPVVPLVEEITKNEKSGQQKPSGSIAAEVNNSKVEKLEQKKTSVSKSGAKDGYLLKNEGESNIAKKAAFLKSKSSEEVPKPYTSTAKRGSTDSGMPSKPSAIEQRKLALQLKMNDDPLKSIKPSRNEIKKSQSTNPNSERSKFSSTPSSGSNRSSTNSSPGEIRKSANISPVPHRTESPVLGTQKKTSNTSPLPARKSDKTARFTSDKQKTDLPEQSPKTSRNSFRGKIPGGIAAKMANKFDSSSGRSSPQHNQKTERKTNLKDERISRAKSDIKPDEPIPKIDPKGSTTDKKSVKSVMQNESTQKGPAAVSSTNESKGPLSNNSSKVNNPLKMPEKQNQDIKFCLALGGSVSPSGKKLTIGPLVSLAEKKGDDNVQKKDVDLEKAEEVREGRKELDGKQPIRMKMGSGAPIKLGIGRPQRKSGDDSIKMDESSKRAPMLKETRGKSQSLSRRRAGTNDSSPSSSRKNYRRLYVTKVRNSRVFDADLQIDTAAAAEIMQRVDNDVLKVEFRLKSTDLKLLPA